MSDTLARHWWILAIRSVVAVLFIIGFAVYVLPGPNALVLAFQLRGLRLLSGQR
jgi:hypothetical protein